MTDQQHLSVHEQLARWKAYERHKIDLKASQITAEQLRDYEWVPKTDEEIEKDNQARVETCKRTFKDPLLVASVVTLVGVFLYCTHGLQYGDFNTPRDAWDNRNAFIAVFFVTLALAYFMKLFFPNLVLRRPGPQQKSFCPRCTQGHAPSLQNCPECGGPLENLENFKLVEIKKASQVTSQ